MKNQKKFELLQYVGITITSISLFAIGIFSFNSWLFFASVLVALLFYLVILIGEHESTQLDIVSDGNMIALLSGFLFLVLWVLIQLISGIFWCFLICAIITIFFHMFRFPLYILLFDYNCDEEGCKREGEENLTKSEIVYKAFTNKYFIDFYFPYNWWYILIFVIYILVGLIVLPREIKDASQSERITTASEKGGNAFYKATTVKVLNQIENNNTVYYIITSNDTLWCEYWKGAIFLKSEGGDRIEYRLKKSTYKKRIEELIIR